MIDFFERENHNHNKRRQPITDLIWVDFFNVKLFEK